MLTIIITNVNLLLTELIVLIKLTKLIAIHLPTLNNHVKILLLCLLYNSLTIFFK